MALAVGPISQVLVGQSVASLSVAAATGGSGTYTYQWYRGTVSAFTPASSNLIAGATALTLDDSGLIPGSNYWYEVIVSDTVSSTTADSVQLAIFTDPSQSPNQFSQQSYVGMVDLLSGPTNIVAAQIDASVANGTDPWNIVLPGQAVKLVANTAGGVPHIAPCSSNTDHCIGYVTYAFKDKSYPAGTNCEAGMWGTAMWLISTAAITQGSQVCLDVSQVGGVQPTGNSSVIVGMALDGASAAGQLIRVMLTPNPSFATA